MPLFPPLHYPHTRTYHGCCCSHTHKPPHRPTEEELAEFGRPHITVYDAGPFPANRFTSYMTSSTSISISLKHREMVRAPAVVGVRVLLC